MVQKSHSNCTYFKFQEYSIDANIILVTQHVHLMRNFGSYAKNQAENNADKYPSIPSEDAVANYLIAADP